MLKVINNNGYTCDFELLNDNDSLHNARIMLRREKNIKIKGNIKFGKDPSKKSFMVGKYLIK